MPLVFPIIFLFLFLDASGDADRSPAMRLGIIDEQVTTDLVDGLVNTGLVDIDYVSQELKLYIRPGFESWADAIINQVNNQANSYGDKDSALTSNSIIVTEETDNGYVAFLLPGLFVMVLIQLATTSTANLVLNDRMDGTLRIVSSTKGAVVPLFFAEVIFRLIFTLVCFMVMLILINEMASFNLSGRYIIFIGVYILGALMMIVMGYAMGGVLPSRRNWGAIITLVGLACWFFSDILFQASQHELARPISLMLPPTYLTDALRQISTGQPGTFSLGFDVVMIIGWFILLSFIAIKYFKFETSDNRM